MLPGVQRQGIMFQFITKFIFYLNGFFSKIDDRGEKEHLLHKLNFAQMS